MATTVEKLKETNPIGWKTLAHATRCSRCGGLMIIEPCFDSLARRCVQCGNLVDEVILQNRRLRLPNIIGKGEKVSARTGSIL